MLVSKALLMTWQINLPGSILLLLCILQLFSASSVYASILSRQDVGMKQNAGIFAATP